MARMLKFSINSPGLYETDGLNVDGLVSWAQEIRDQVPAEYRASSKVRYEDGDYTVFEVTWSRPESPEEEAERSRKEIEASKEIVRKREQSDRALYEQLKARFGQ